MQFSKRVICNADDYGACAAVNGAIEALVAADVLGGVSVLVNGASWEGAADFLRTHPHVSAGVHLNLIEGTPVTPANQIRVLLGSDGKLIGRNAILGRWLVRPWAVARAVELEWRTQIERLLQAGIRLTHADSHQHLHAFPPAFRIAVRLCREYGIPALRVPCEQNAIPLRQLPTIALNANLKLAHTADSGLRHNDHFLGFKRAGMYGLRELLTDLATVRPGVTEIALHPSLENYRPYPKLRGADERLALLNPAFRAELNRQEIQLIHWHDV